MPKICYNILCTYYCIIIKLNGPGNANMGKHSAKKVLTRKILLMHLNQKQKRISAERDGGWRKSQVWKLLIWAVFIVPFAIYLRRRQQPNEKEGKKGNWMEKMAIKKIVQFETAVKRREEGGGFMVRRPVGDKIDMVDPFLMLDHLGPTVYGPGEAIGAPDHPHRGFETVTYIIDGKYNLALESIYKFMYVSTAVKLFMFINQETHL